MEMLIKIRHTLELVKFSHSIFALPFALASVFFASAGWPPLKTLVLIILAMITARNTAMAFNRLVDAKIDSQNPRTSMRHLPKNLLSPKYVTLFVIFNALLFIIISSYFNILTFYLSPIALIIICGYSTMKHITHASQIFLGLALGIAPIAAWIAVTGEIAFFPILIGTGVLFWVAGFDILYATQDYEFDKKAGLKSLVVWLGIRKGLKLSRFFHAISIVIFGIAGWFQGLHLFYYTAILLMGICLAYEHSLVKPNDLSRINMAFFNLNGLVGMLFLAGSIAEVFFG